jgi:phage shock protein C
MSQSTRHGTPDETTTQIEHEYEFEDRYRGERRQLRRSKTNRVIGGVCGGLGRYFGIDPVLFRIGFIALLIFGGSGLLLYIISWIAIPEFRSAQDESTDSLRLPVNHRISGLIVGGGLVLIGTMILLQRFVDWFDVRVMGAGVLILIGAVILYRGLQSEARS